MNPLEKSRREKSCGAFEGCPGCGCMVMGSVPERTEHHSAPAELFPKVNHSTSYIFAKNQHLGDVIVLKLFDYVACQT